MLNAIFDARQTEPSCAVEHLTPELLRQHDRNFAGWWNADQRSDGFRDSERTIYHALMVHREGTAAGLAQPAGQSLI
jgi:hypothetical protein